MEKSLIEIAYEFLSNQKGEGYVDTGVKILISVVIGTLILTGLYALFSETLLPDLESKISELFNYGATA